MAPSLLALASVLTAAAGTAASLADSPGAEAGAASSVVTVRKGDRGRAVKAVQRRLRLTADGVFGPADPPRREALPEAQGPRGRRHRRPADPPRAPAAGPSARAWSSARRRKRSSSNGSGGGVSNLPRALKRIAECESGGDPRAVSPDGTYRGKYQFTRSTWKAYGGRTRDPINASEAHQDRVALKLYRARGTDPWPSCGA